MAITKEQITGIKYGGIYYTDQFNFTTGEGTLTCSKLRKVDYDKLSNK